jgi:hypothetical protein
VDGESISITKSGVPSTLRMPSFVLSHTTTISGIKIVASFSNRCTPGDVKTLQFLPLRNVCKLVDISTTIP